MNAKSNSKLPIKENTHSDQYNSNGSDSEQLRVNTLQQSLLNSAKEWKERLEVLKLNIERGEVILSPLIDNLLKLLEHQDKSNTSTNATPSY